MSAPANNQLDALEAAIMARANELALEFRDKAERQRDTILRDAADRLHMAEQREVLIAKAEAEKLIADASAETERMREHANEMLATIEEIKFYSRSMRPSGYQRPELWQR